MNERIKKVRKTLKLTQEQFGKIIGVTGAACSTIESGKNNPSIQTIKSICREFDVNEAWLLTGEGEMFLKRSREQEIGEFFADVVKDNKFKKRLVLMLAKMNTEEWELLERKLKELIEEDDEEE